MMRTLALLLACAVVSCSEEKKAEEPSIVEGDEVSPPDQCETRSGEICSTFPQCGCPGTDNCNIVTASGHTACVPVPSSAAGLHGKCDKAGDCQKGLQCYGGVCVPLCLDSDSDCTIANSPRCKRVTFAAPITPDDTPDAAPTDARPVPVEVPGFGVCLAQCDPMSPAAVCGDGRACTFFSTSDATTQCVSPGAATGAGGCKTSVLACAAGYGCFDGDCRKICRVGMAADCPGAACTAFATPVTIGGTQYGTCP